jgi:hypothetical protein
MPTSTTFNKIFPDLQDFQAWNQQVQISKTFQIFKAPYEPCVSEQCFFKFIILKYVVRVLPRTALVVALSSTKLEEIR